MTGFNDNFMSKQPSSVIFDMDGTLVDSARDLSGALNHVLSLAKRPYIDISQVRDMVGDGARALIVKGFSETGALPDTHEIDEILKVFLDYYSENITSQTIIFPGALAVIEKLAEMKIPMGVCTNKSIRLTEKLVKEIGMARYFSAIVGGDSFTYRKPDPRHLTSTLAMMNSPIKGAVMVGDSANDILAAQGAGIPVIGVSFGYTKIPLSQLDPDIIIDHFDDFFKALANLSKNF